MRDIELPRLLTAKKEENFSEWFNELIEVSKLIDTRYPIKGCYVWRNYGYKLRENVIKLIRQFLDETGHLEEYFPFLIPEEIFRKESEFIKGFEDQVYWVTHGGLDELSVKLVVRPTSETPIYYMFKQWVRSHADLPIKVYQIVSVFRYETKQTRPLIRVREITTFKEAHTIHASSKDAENQIVEAIGVYKKFFDTLGISHVVSRRPDFDKFPGADITYAFDTLFPTGRSLQIGTVHNLGQNFSRKEGFDICFKTPEGKDEWGYQTCYGISERVIASIVAIFGDNRGLRLPPIVAPIQVIIVPIMHKSNKDLIIEHAKSLFVSLSNNGLRVHLDDRDISPGKKFYEWELKGVPIRIEIGLREIEKGKYTLLRRDTMEKATLNRDTLIKDVSDLLEDVTKNLYANADEYFKNSIFKVESFFDLEKVDAIDIFTEKRGGIIKVPVCEEEYKDDNDKEKCQKIISKYVTVLGKQYENDEPVEGSCVCGKKGVKYVFVSMSY